MREKGREEKKEEMSQMRYHSGTSILSASTLPPFSLSLSCALRDKRRKKRAIICRAVRCTGRTSESS